MSFFPVGVLWIYPEQPTFPGVCPSVELDALCDVADE